jgi:quinol monooxygenase YgiN
VIVEYIRYRIPPDRCASFIDAYEQAAGYLSASPECLAYELSHCIEEQERYVLRIEWKSIQEHLDGFRKGTAFQEFLRLVQPFVQHIEEMKHYELTDIVHWK